MSNDDKKKLERARYVELVFSVGLKPYMQSLEKHGIVRKKNILDVGCGPGQWTFAAAKLNPEALVVGIDIDEALLDFAIRYKKKNDIKNCKFFTENYENLLKIFQSESFDVIMCNNVIQYVNDKKAFRIFSQLLKKDGTLIMFYNSGPGYYLWKFFSGIRDLDLGDIIYGATTLIKTLGNRTLNRKVQDHFVTLGYLKKVSKEFGIALTQIETEPRLVYRDRYLGVPYVFSCKGILRN